jgi:hypothetical protein
VTLLIIDAPHCYAAILALRSVPRLHARLRASAETRLTMALYVTDFAAAEDSMRHRLALGGKTMSQVGRDRRKELYE